MKNYEIEKEIKDRITSRFLVIVYVVLLAEFLIVALVITCAISIVLTAIGNVLN